MVNCGLRQELDIFTLIGWNTVRETQVKHAKTVSDLTKCLTDIDLHHRIEFLTFITFIQNYLYKWKINRLVYLTALLYVVEILRYGSVLLKFRPLIEIGINIK